VSVVDMIRGAY